MQWTASSISVRRNVVRFKTGNIPTGIAVRGRFGYVNNEVGHSVSILDLNSNGNTVAFNVPSSEPPKPGTHEHAVLLGKLVFFTALGVSDNGLVGQQIRAIDPLLFRGKQSNNAWSTCGSCHPAGLSDGVTWIFGDGPRNTIPLDGLYSKINGPHDIRINNYSAARDSVTDFNNNSRGVQGGVGFASDPPVQRRGAQPGGLRPRDLAGRERGPGFRDRVGRDRAAAQPAAGPRRGRRSRGVRHQLRLLPRRREVDQEPGDLRQQPGPRRGRCAPRYGRCATRGS